MCAGDRLKNLARPGTHRPLDFTTLVRNLRRVTITGRPRHFELDTIVDAGLALIEAEGVGALSMQAVARRLGTGRATLYNYVDSREELIDLMLGRALADQPQLAEVMDVTDWPEALVRFMVAAFRAGVERPAVLQLFMQNPKVHLGVVARGQDELRALEGIGFAPPRAAEVFRMLVSQLLGHIGSAAALAVRPESAILEAGTELGAAQRHLDDLGEERLYETAVRTLVSGLAAELKANEHP
jgi:AcrR family transcriptional regulator